MAEKRTMEFVCLSCLVPVYHEEIGQGGGQRFMIGPALHDQAAEMPGLNLTLRTPQF
jgi:hypothetical protein